MTQHKYLTLRPLPRRSRGRILSRRSSSGALHDVVPIDTRMSTSSGSLSSPMGASAEIGKMLTQWLVERVVAIVDDEFAQRTSTRDGQQVSRA